MIKTYIKKPIPIEAVLLTHNNIEKVAHWCKGLHRGVKLPINEQVIQIQTLEGEMIARMGDYVIKGIQGEFYPCKPDIFEASYDEQ